MEGSRKRVKLSNPAEVPAGSDAQQLLLSLLGNANRTSTRMLDTSSLLPRTSATGPIGSFLRQQATSATYPVAGTPLQAPDVAPLRQNEAVQLSSLSGLTGLDLLRSMESQRQNRTGAPLSIDSLFMGGATRQPSSLPAIDLLNEQKQAVLRAQLAAELSGSSQIAQQALGIPHSIIDNRGLLQHHLQGSLLQGSGAVGNLADAALKRTLESTSTARLGMTGQRALLPPPGPLPGVGRVPFPLRRNQHIAAEPAALVGATTSADNKTFDKAPSASFEGDKLVPLALPSDHLAMSKYQCLLRQQLVFAASTSLEDGGRTQGRNRAIVANQVGVLCRHCARLPRRKRPRGAVYYPSKLNRIYQAAQNMSRNHFLDSCKAIPEVVRHQLNILKDQKAMNVSAGKEYWSEAAARVGVREGESGLFFDGMETAKGALEKKE